MMHIFICFMENPQSRSQSTHHPAIAYLLVILPVFSVSHTPYISSCFKVFAGLPVPKSLHSHVLPASTADLRFTVNNSGMSSVSHPHPNHHWAPPLHFTGHSLLLHVYLCKCHLMFMFPTGWKYWRRCLFLLITVSLALVKIGTLTKVRWSAPKIDIWMDESEEGSWVLELQCSWVIGQILC